MAHSRFYAIRCRECCKWQLLRPGQSCEITTCTCMFKVEPLQTFLIYFGVWVQIWSCLSVFILFITGDREVISSQIVFVCLFGTIPTIWIRLNDTACTIVCRYIGGHVYRCVMHSWRHWWCHHLKKLNNFSSTSAGITLSGSRDIFLAQSSFGFG